MRAIFFAVWLVAGCKTSHVLDAASHTDAASAAQIDTHEVKSEGPEHIEMTVDEYAVLCPGDHPNPAPAGDSGRSGTVDAKQVIGPLIRRTVTVTDRGPSLDDLRTISSLQSKLNTATEIKTKDLREFLSGLWPWLLGASGAAALVLLKPAWLGIAFKGLGVAWGALKSLFGRKAS